jgi:hypothetical protein
MKSYVNVLYYRIIAGYPTIILSTVLIDEAQHFTVKLPNSLPLFVCLQDIEFFGRLQGMSGLQADY